MPVLVALVAGLHASARPDPACRGLHRPQGHRPAAEALSDRGKIRSRRVTGVTVQQRQIARAVKTARKMALLPHSSGQAR